MTAYPIWQIKFCTQEVLVDTCKVSMGKIYIYFVADRNHKDLYSFDGKWVREHCKVTSNGKIYCFCVPVNALVNEGELPSELEKQREIEYAKFKAYQEKMRVKK